ncbi:hypothetical protein RE476_07165 [Methanolobus mangrovi]|uniref:Uncharacterized protein n=1 Tax=Methanolobus mangrovi TaxID=3072977 RepID=A0AA51UGC4_9EURY|nr:hypothetical protein [Methanolobus mangrovi]WMW21191.1 hypothetical protein RE476_07165 [Methanolobus mangrovi]
MTFDKVETDRILKNDTTGITQYQQMQLVLSERRPADSMPDTKGKINRAFNKFWSGVSLHPDRMCSMQRKIHRCPL